jgi:hypothetical protein
MKMTVTLTAVLLAMRLAPLPAGEVQDAKEVLMKAKEAAGGSALDSLRTVHTELKITTGGLEGTAETWENIETGKFTSRFELGPVRGEEGFDGELPWTRDSSGQVLRGEGEDARQGAMNGAYRTCLAYWFPERWPAEVTHAGLKEESGRKFHVVRIIPQGGRPFDLWIDAATWLIDRTVEKQAVETRTIFFSDYRQVHGVRYPFSSRSTNGETQYDFFASVEKVEFNMPLDETMFGMPAPPPPDYSFAAGKTSTTVPFTLLNNHIYLEVRLNGKGPFLFLCDTGGANVLTPALAAELGLTPMGAVQGRGVGEKSEDVGFVKMDSITVGEVTLKDQLFAVFPLESFSAVEGVPQSGLIGYEVFKRFVAKVSYGESLLTLLLPGAFTYEGSGTVLPFHFDGRIPQVEGSIDGIPGKFDIDTGSRASLTLLAPFVEAHGLVERLAPRFEGVTGWGVGGPARGLMTRAKSLRLGDIAIENPVAELSLQKKGAFTDTYVAGNVGAGLLKKFDIVFDYGRQQMIFEPNTNASKPDVYDRSGMWVNKPDSVFQVVDVIKGGPAEKAGLEAGEAIVSIDGKSARELSLPLLRERFRTDPAGTAILLKVRNERGEREIILVLEDLV